jgi:hypothetical protein
LGFGIAALVFGMLGVLTICIPVVPVVIAGLGMVLALVGMACSARRGGILMPIIGAIVCAVPIVLVVGTYAGLFALAVFGRPGTPTGPGPTTIWVPSATAPATTGPSSAPTIAPTPESSRESDSQPER